jgi:hypothetical protein
MTNEELRNVLCDDKLMRESLAEARIMFIKAQLEASQISRWLLRSVENYKKDVKKSS